MSKINSLTVGGVVLLGVLAGWQFFEISRLKEANAALSQQAQFASAGTMATDSSFDERATNSESGKAVIIANTETRAAEITQEQTARSAQFKKMRMMDRTQRHDAKILALTTKLNLTSEQQSAVREALEKGSADRDAIRDAADVRRRAGKQDTDEQRQADWVSVAAIETAQEEKIATGMSADQLAAYAAYQTEQKQVTVEGQANQQLADLANKFSLSEEQKEAAFQYFASQEAENETIQARAVAAGGDLRALFEQRQKEHQAGMKLILTPEQFKLYSAQQDQRSAVFGGMTPRGPGRRP